MDVKVGDLYLFRMLNPGNYHNHTKNTRRKSTDFETWTRVQFDLKMHPHMLFHSFMNMESWKFLEIGQPPVLKLRLFFPESVQ